MIWMQKRPRVAARAPMQGRPYGHGIKAVSNSTRVCWTFAARQLIVRALNLDQGPGHAVSLLDRNAIRAQ